MDVFKNLIEQEDFNSCKYIGMGSGTTVESFINFLDEHNLGRNIIYIPTSFKTKLDLIRKGFSVADLHHNSAEIELAIDGFDFITTESEKNTMGESSVIIKGGGGCMTWEKLVAFSARKFVIIGSKSKLSKDIIVIPVEILPMASLILLKSFQKKFPENPVSIRTSDKSGKLGPIVTDFGNWIIDITFERERFSELDAFELHKWLKMQVGVVETGIFIIPHKQYLLDVNY